MINGDLKKGKCSKCGRAEDWIFEDQHGELMSLCYEHAVELLVVTGMDEIKARQFLMEETNKRTMETTDEVMFGMKEKDMPRA